jgi:hypothetical protein
MMLHSFPLAAKNSTASYSPLHAGSRHSFMPLQRETESRFEKLERLAGIDVEAA